MKSLTVRQFFRTFPDDDACLEHIFQCRFGDDYDCPKCEKNTKWHKIKAERAYSCQYCGHHLHPTVGTLFEKSRTPLQLWFYAMFLFTTTRHGVSAKELQRQLGVTYKTAWRMGHEIREHMSEVDNLNFGPMSGHVEVDEVHLGGKCKMEERADKKTIVVGLLERDGDIHTQIVPDAKADSLMPVITENVEVGTIVSTDQNRAYHPLAGEGYKHGKVQHAAKQYRNGIHHTNGIEGYWHILQASIASTHMHVSRKHLPKYLGEFEYRHNTRGDASSMFPELISTYPEQADE